MNDRQRVRWLNASGAPANHAAVDHLTDFVSAGKVTLLFGAHDIEHNNAVALADYLAAN
jgi:uncharacterized protein YeaO (DUF488 family)